MKSRMNLTVSTETVEALAAQANASAYIDALVAYAQAFGLPATPSDLRKAVTRRAAGRPV